MTASIPDLVEEYIGLRRGLGYRSVTQERSEIERTNPLWQIPLVLAGKSQLLALSAGAAPQVVEIGAPLAELRPEAELDAQREALINEAKADALKRAEAAVAELKELGFDYHLKSPEQLGYVPFDQAFHQPKRTPRNVAAEKRLDRMAEA